MVPHMAVELRCPDCRAKLRLKVAPEAGTEVECPKCGTVFPAPEPEPEPNEDAPKPKKKSAASAEDDEKDKTDSEKKDKKTKTKKDAKPGASKTPKKRKFKKKETSKAALIAVISIGVFMLLCMTGVLIWFFGRTPKSVEMFYYVPEDSQTAIGINLGHAQKYPEFYKSLKSTIESSDFKTPGDAIAKAAGTDFNGLLDYAVKANSSKSGWAIVFRTKAEFDAGALAKIPGAEKKSADGKTYYTAPDLLTNNQRGLVFAPTNRLIVVCPTTMDGQPAFKKMLNGHGDNKDKTLGVRMGDLGKRITRGTFWQLILFDTDLKSESVLPGTDKNSGGSREDSQQKKLKVFSDALNSTRGMGIKASIGSRQVRFEIAITYGDSDKASSFAKVMKESDLGKGDEGEPPKWFKDDTMSLGDKKIAAQLLSNIGFGSSGAIFYVTSYVDTLDLQPSSGRLIGAVLGIAQRQGGGVPMGGGPGGAPPNLPPGGPGGGGKPGGGKPRRRPNPARVRR
jgi:hypothetical protein